MSRDSSEERVAAPKCTFEVYRSEGDTLFLKKKYDNAILCYTKALELREKDLHCLLRRSCCYSSIGEIDKALEDSDAALNTSPDNHRGLLQKAEVLYNRGEFEYALMFFHRGHQKRPELHAFRIGIQKCEEAVKNSLHLTKGLQITEEGSEKFKAQMDEQPQKRPTVKTTQKTEKDKKSDDIPLHILSPAKSKAFFGYLYEDHEYLEKLVHQEAIKKWRTACSDEVKQIAKNGLNYLDARSQFWHQEKPIYARRKARPGKKMEKSREKEPTATEQSINIFQVLETLREIDQYQRHQQHDLAIKAAETLRQQVSQWTDAFCPNRLEVLANVNSMLGLSYLEMDRLEEALDAHEQAYALGHRCDLPEIVSHAVDNIGRVHAKKGEYQEAIDIWKKKLGDTKNDYELIWLNYEIGRCHLEMEQSHEALKYGLKALDLSTQIGDDAWQLNINVLIGQANLQLENRSEALEAFRSAHELAKTLSAEEAERAIMQVIDEFEETEFGVDTDSLTQDELLFRRSPALPLQLHFQRTKSRTDEYDSKVY
ncbi:Tetratricopeptide repeat protein 25 [Fasciola hepatica]|uniref:Outer dynein arm-docking complex subunit 4 n=1 Tax=Fasciola hepatica TaxID=6192 RepID=A0A4E0RAA4_FASHE|nr:Tetratricopeptide repeat protein 25 [Fasciola hepatica]